MLSFDDFVKAKLILHGGGKGFYGGIKVFKKFVIGG
jgi:hypothetical protein